jgi:hypothetical protein
MSDELPPIDAVKAKINAFAKELQPTLAAAGLSKVSLIIMPNRIRVDTEGTQQPKPVQTPATPS